MHFTQATIAWFAAVISAASAASDSSSVYRQWCPVDVPENIHEIHQLVEEARAADSHSLALRADEKFEIDVYFHVVAKSKKLADGYIPKSQIDEVIQITNDAYAPTPFHFTLKDTDWTINTVWQPDPNLENDYQMKKTLRKGSYRTLNVYIMKDWSGGYAALPITVKQDNHDFVEDGVVLGPDALNGSDHFVYNQGKTLAHETGHWLGLLHTFEGDDCNGTGDFVDDTPAERFLLNNPDWETIECPKDLDSCPNQPGYDPLDNYMDYSKDKCKNNFTPGQITRMIDHYKTFRQSWA